MEGCCGTVWALVNSFHNFSGFSSIGVAVPITRWGMGIFQTSCQHSYRSVSSAMRRFVFVILTLLLAANARAVQLGIDRLQADGFQQLAGKRVGLVTNQTGVSSGGSKTRVILKNAGKVKLVALFSPEHGIDGTVLAGRYVSSRRDAATGLPVHSLYGPTRKPTREMLAGLDALVFDMQDIGVRSYTYVSCMALCMEAAGENGLEFIVLDRPNPLGGLRVEGPPIEARWKSYVGQFPVPYLHGMTTGELARMANANGWTGARCKLTVVPMTGWSRGMMWSDTGLRWVQTSPNIPRADSCAYYAATSIPGSLDGVGIEIGAGQPFPFEIVCSKWLDAGTFTARMRSLGLPGVSFEPITFEGKQGSRIRLSPRSPVNFAALGVQILSEVNRPALPSVFARYHDADGIFWKIYGSTSIRSQLASTAPQRIAAGWESGVARFKSARQGYLLYQ